MRLAALLSTLLPLVVAGAFLTTADAQEAAAAVPAARIAVHAARMLDVESGRVVADPLVLVEGDKIKEVSEKPIKAPDAATIDCGGRTLMPGLIDSHVHVVLSEVSIPRLENVPLTLMTARAAVLMRAMLDRGFTSVRDTGGADWGLKEATDKWLLPGPRLFIAGCRDAR